MASKTQHPENDIGTFWNKPSSRHQINIQGKQIEWKPKTTYLGVTLDKSLRLNDHVKPCVQKAKRAKRVLYPILNNKSLIPMPTRQLLYAATAWRPLISESNWKNIEVDLTKNYNILSPPINPLREEPRTAAKIFFHRNSQLSFPHIRDLG